MAIQLLPFGRQHTNPGISAEPDWPDPAIRTLAVRTCFDCHSNQTAWPWYSSVAPISWITQRHVDEGRQVLNFSEWGRPQEGLREAGEAVEEGEMPPGYYRFLHRSARLSPAETAALAQALGSLR
jgi:hypothetical protein